MLVYPFARWVISSVLAKVTRQMPVRMRETVAFGYCPSFWSPFLWDRSTLLTTVYSWTQKHLNNTGVWEQQHSVPGHLPVACVLRSDNFKAGGCYRSCWCNIPRAGVKESAYLCVRGRSSPLAMMESTAHPNQRQEGVALNCCILDLSEAILLFAARFMVTRDKIIA